MKSTASAVFEKIAKPMPKKALESEISHAAEQLGNSTSEKAGDLIIKQLSKMRQGPNKQQNMMPNTFMTQQEKSTDMILSRLISGDGIKRRRKII